MEKKTNVCKNPTPRTAECCSSPDPLVEPESTQGKKSTKASKAKPVQQEQDLKILYDSLLKKMDSMSSQMEKLMKQNQDKDDLIKELLQKIDHLQANSFQKW